MTLIEISAASLVFCGSMAATSSSSTHPSKWESVLNGHPIFDPSAGSGNDKSPNKTDHASLELSISSLSKSKPSNGIQDGGVPSGRRRVMLIKDADLIVAAGKRVRMTSLTESQLSAAGEQTFKVINNGVGGYASLIPTYRLRHYPRQTCNSKSTNSC